MESWSDKQIVELLRVELSNWADFKPDPHRDRELLLRIDAWLNPEFYQ